MMSSVDKADVPKRYNKAEHVLIDRIYTVKWRNVGKREHNYPKLN